MIPLHRFRLPRRFLALAVCALASATALLAAPSASAPPAKDAHPFPLDVTYAHGIVPSRVSQSDKNADLLKMWQAWRDTYLIQEGAAPGELRVTMGGARGTSISEGIGFGMLISVHVAAPGNSGKADFDALYRYYARHEKVMNSVRYGLMAWRIGANNQILDNWVAPDGDMDAAYALLVADKKWGSAGEINYRGAAVTIIDSLMRWSVNKPSFTISRGEFESKYTMSSYHMVNHFPAFAKASGDDRWLKANAAAYSMYEYFLNLNPHTGLTPYTFNVADYSYHPRGYHYGYDSSRVAWRVGLDYLWRGEKHSPVARLLPDRQAKWLKKITGGDLDSPYARYNLDGTRFKESGKDPRITVAPMAVGAMVDASNQEWLDTQYAWLRRQIPGERVGGAGPSYFADTVMVCCMLVLTGNMPDLTDSAAP